MDGRLARPSQIQYLIMACHGKTLDGIGKDLTSDCFRGSTRSADGGRQCPPCKWAVWPRGLGVSCTAVSSWAWPSLADRGRAKTRAACRCAQSRPLRSAQDRRSTTCEGFDDPRNPASAEFPHGLDPYRPSEQVCFREALSVSGSDQTAIARGEISFEMVLAFTFSATRRSYAVCRFSQPCASLPK